MASNLLTSLPHIFLISEEGLLSFEIINLLLKLGCRTSVICNNSNGFKDFLNRKNFSVFDFETLERKPDLLFQQKSFIIFLETFNPRKFNLKLFQKKIKLANIILEEEASRGIFAFPLNHKEGDVKNIELIEKTLNFKEKSFIGEVFLGDVVDSPQDNFLINQFFEKASKRQNIDFVSTSFKFYPISSRIAAETLIDCLFSLKAYGKKISVLGRSLNARDILRILKRVDKDLKISFTTKNQNFVKPNTDFKVKKEEEIRDLILTSYLAVLKKNKDQGFIFSGKYSKLFERRKINLNIFSFRKKIFLKVVTLLFLFFFFPLISFILGVILLFLTNKAFLVDNIYISNLFLQASKVNNKLSEIYFKLPSFILPFKNIYTKVEEDNLLIQSEINIFRKIYNLNHLVWEFADLSFSGKKEGADLIRKISLEFYSLYRDLSFLKGEFTSGRNLAFLNIEKTLPFSVDFKDKFLILSEFFKYLGEDLRRGEVKRFALVIQDSRFLRPSGGVVRGVVVFTLSGTEVLDVKIYPSFEIDKNLKGLIEPPKALKVYFDQKNWFLRDAGWERDFSIFAKKIEWFLDKNLNLEVDAVFSVDVSVLEEILKIKKDDKNRGLEPELEEAFNVSYEIENYPRIKEDLLLKNFNSLLNRILKPKGDNEKIRRLKILLNSLGKKDIQVFFNEERLNNIFSSLSLSSELNYLNCEECFNDTLSLSEFSNSECAKDLKREARLSIFFEEKLVKRRLDFFLGNKMDKDCSVYLKILVPQESGFSPPKFLTKTKEEISKPDFYSFPSYKEMGLFVKIPPRNYKILEVSWESGFDQEKTKDYSILINKQLGVLSYAFEVVFKISKGTPFVPDFKYSLTKNSELIYNTNLSRDIRLRLFFDSKRE